MSRARATAGVLALALAMGASACGSGLNPFSDSDEGPTMVGLTYSDYAHEDEPFAEELFAEHATLPEVWIDELGFFQHADFDGTYTHVSNGERASLEVPGDPPEVWFFGGSSLFGIGQRDDHTIPSEIVKLAADAGTPVHAANFGATGYQSWREVAVLRKALAERTPPDLVVFYHGLNELGTICRQLALGIAADGLGDPLVQPQPETPVVDCFDQPAETARLTVASMEREMDTARYLLGDVPVLDYWQPYVATRTPTPADEPLYDRLGMRAEDLPRMVEPYRLAIELMEPEPIDVTDAWDGYDGPVLFDWAHTNEVGADLAAEAMWERGLRDAVAELHDR